MDLIAKFLKIILLLVLILVGLGVLGGMYFVYQGVRSGNLEGYLKSKAVSAVIPEEKLTSEQRDMLEAGDIESLVQDIGENVTPAQVDCMVEKLGAERAQELVTSKDPTPQELIKISGCL